jgi:uncharacterized protein (DUF885 family)
VPFPEGEIRVEPTPAFLRHFVPAVWCDPPGPEEAGKTGVLYVTESPEANGQAHGRHETWAWAAAEAYPGFFLQRRVAAGLSSLVRRYLWTPLTVRGWALYVEELMAEAGLAGRRPSGCWERSAAGAAVHHSRRWAPHPGMTPTMPSPTR